jgi:hypothetical protein
MTSYLAIVGSKRVARTGRALLLLGAAACLGLASPALAADAKPKAAAKAKAKAKAKAEPKVTAPSLTAAQIVQKHEAARGGAKAWKTVQALSGSGKIDAGNAESLARARRIAAGAGTGSRKERREIAAAGKPQELEKQLQLPFKLAMARPNKSRLEVEFDGKTAVQVYDGANGWKVRPFLNKNEVEPFTPQEAKGEAESADLDGYLVGAQAKGTKVEAAGVEKVDGRAAYKLKVTTKAGVVRNVWVDARTFLDVKVEGTPRRMDGKLHQVFVYQRDFRAVQGVKVPFALETVVEGYPQVHKIRFDKMAVNPKLAAATFAKPKA